MCGERELDTGGEGGMKGLVGWGDWLEETEITGAGTRRSDMLINML